MNNLDGNAWKKFGELNSLAVGRGGGGAYIFNQCNVAHRGLWPRLQAPAKAPSPCRKERCWPWWRKTKATVGHASAGATGTKATSRRLTSPSRSINDTPHACESKKKRTPLKKKRKKRKKKKKLIGSSSLWGAFTKMQQRLWAGPESGSRKSGGGCGWLLEV